MLLGENDTAKRTRAFGLWAWAALGAVGMAGCTGVLTEPTGSADSSPVMTGSGIPLSPPSGIGMRALRCETDHAPLRRLSSEEYGRTLGALFPDECRSDRAHRC